jgi:hypothetical protein
LRKYLTTIVAKQDFWSQHYGRLPLSAGCLESHDISNDKKLFYSRWICSTPTAEFSEENEMKPTFGEVLKRV